MSINANLLAPAEPLEYPAGEGYPPRTDEENQQYYEAMYTSLAESQNIPGLWGISYESSSDSSSDATASSSDPMECSTDEDYDPSGDDLLDEDYQHWGEWEHIDPADPAYPVITVDSETDDEDTVEPAPAPLRYEVMKHNPLKRRRLEQ